MIRLITVLFTILVTFAACTTSGDSITLSEPVTGIDSTLTGQPVFTDTSEGISEFDTINILGKVDVTWNPANGEVAVESRSANIAAIHGRITFFLTPPFCYDCLIVSLTAMDPTLGTGSFDVTVRNPTIFDVYEVRSMIVYQEGVDLAVLNADGYTSLFETAGYVSPTAFRLFARNKPGHLFGGYEHHTVSFDMKTTPGMSPVNFSVVISVALPENPGDVSYIGEFRQYGQLLPGGGTAYVSFDILDLQNDIGGVFLHTDELGSAGTWLLPSNGRWEATLTNYLAIPGNYTFRVDAHSASHQQGVTSNYYRAVVFPDYTTFRNQMLSLLNADRANFGLGPVAMDEILNTVAQYHAQDMAEKVYFNHINLDGWTPWKRMAYFGYDYYTAGENIAVGQDSPSEVEIAWMNSAGHKANILNNSFGHVGLGIVETPPGDPYAPGYYWVQVFSD